MIDPKQFRIGNLAYDNEEGSVILITGFQPHDHSTRCDEKEGCVILFDIYGSDGKIRQGYENESNNCNPIELAPIWLERCGFILRSDKTNIWQHGRLSLWLEKGCLCYLTHEDHDNANYYIPNGGINYLHQLQNLYYSLMGKELTIKSFNQSN